MRFAYRYLIDHGIRGAFLVDGPFERRPGVGPRLPEPAPRARRLRAEAAGALASTSRRASTGGCSTRSQRRATAATASGWSAPERPGPCPASLRARSERWCRASARASRASSPTSARRTRTCSTGWNIGDFDVPVLQRVARRAQLRLTLGRTDEEAEVRRDLGLHPRPASDPLRPPGAGRPRAPPERLRPARRLPAGHRGPGHPRQGQALRTPSTGARRSRPPGGTTPRRLAAYNLNDARLVVEILERTGLVELTVRRSLLTGMQLDRVGAQIAAVDSLYLAELRARGRVAPSVHIEDAQGTVDLRRPRPRLASPASTGTSSSSTSRASTRA